MTKARPETRQVQFWRTEFGDAYTDRNMPSAEQLRARTAMWAEILACLPGAPPQQILEVGANVGANLRALAALSEAELFAVEPNDHAREILVRDGVVHKANVREGVASKMDIADGAVDMAFTSGVLIHIHPDDLLASCREIHRVSRRYIVCIEYFSDKPEEIGYREQSGLLFKRDYGGFWLDGFADLRVLGYGFRWKRVTGLDNLTWWLFEKRP